MMIRFLTVPFLMLTGVNMIEKPILYAEELLIPLPPYNWGKHMNTPVPDNSGQQLFRFKTKNKDHKQNHNALTFVKKHLENAKAFETDAEVLKFASESVTLKDGCFLEMGVATGRSINFIAALNPKDTIYGFDSFEGLPDDWERSDNLFNKGVFAFKSPIPEIPVLQNVTLYKGWFKDILPRFQRQVLEDKPIALLHMDCDIYTSCADVLSILEKNIVSGTVIVFDEFYNYDNSEDHEYKAFMEFIQRTGKKFQYIAYNSMHEQVVIKIM
jgi:predicted O-methyltransferase YrrM